MPSTGINNGTLAIIQIGATTIAHLTSTDIDFNMETRPATSKDSGGNRDVLEGELSMGASASGYVAEDAAFGFEDLFDAEQARSPVTLKWSTLVAGDTFYTHEVYIKNLKQTAGVEDSVTFDCTFEGTGATTKAVEV